MQFKNPKWKSSDSQQISNKINHFNQKMRRRPTILKINKPITWGHACRVALKYMEKQINDSPVVDLENQ